MINSVDSRVTQMRFASELSPYLSKLWVNYLRSFSLGYLTYKEGITVVPMLSYL